MKTSRLGRMRAPSLSSWVIYPLAGKNDNDSDMNVGSEMKNDSIFIWNNDSNHDDNKYHPISIIIAMKMKNPFPIHHVYH